MNIYLIFTATCLLSTFYGSLGQRVRDAGDCRDLRVKHGKVVCSEDFAGCKTCSYTCNNGWLLFGFDKLECVKNTGGGWNHPESFCTPDHDYCGQKVNGRKVRCPKPTADQMDRMVQIWDTVAEYNRATAVLKEIEKVEESVQIDIRTHHHHPCQSLCKMPCVFFLPKNNKQLHLRSRRNSVQIHNACVKCRKQNHCKKGYQINRQGLFDF